MLWRFIDNPREDSLTASVFTHLLHLPTELFWQILHSACSSNTLPRFSGEPRSHEFWPKWGAAGTIKNTTYVEPDVFIRFADFDVIIEAKRWDVPMHDKSQWEKELIAYANEYGSEKQAVRMIAIGGIHTESDDSLSHQWFDADNESDGARGDSHLFDCPVHMCRWSGLLLECQRMERELEKLRYPSSQSHAHRRILLDLINLFASHGFQTGTWFAELVPRLRLLAFSQTPNHGVLRICPPFSHL